jgi:hypothetical protein
MIGSGGGFRQARRQQNHDSDEVRAKMNLYLYQDITSFYFLASRSRQLFQGYTVLNGGESALYLIVSVQRGYIHFLASLPRPVRAISFFKKSTVSVRTANLLPHDDLLPRIIDRGRGQNIEANCHPTNSAFGQYGSPTVIKDLIFS